MKIPVMYSVKSLLQRKVSTSMTVASFALVVLVLLALLAMLEGVNKTLISAGAEDRLFVLHKSATTENQSRIEAADLPALGLFPEVKVNAEGHPVISAEMVKTAYVETRSGLRTQVNFRGVDPAAAGAVHYRLQITNGRFFETAAGNEVILGQTVFEGIGAAVGDYIMANNRNWHIAGVFTDDGSPFESEIWTSYGNMALGFDLYLFSSVWMLTADAGTTPALVEELNSTPALFVYAVSEKQYFAQGTSAAFGFQALTWFIALVLSVGAIFSAMNTMYASLADRAGELGALRAMGFQVAAVKWTALIETIVMALAGWAAAALAVFFLQGTTFRTPLTGLGYVTFELTITPVLIAIAFLFSLVMGVLGGWIPARQTTRIPIIEALNS